MYDMYNTVLLFWLHANKNGRQSIWRSAPYAILEIESSEKGVLLPRLTSQERDWAFKGKIPLGLMFFNKDLECVQVYLDTISGWECVGIFKDELFEPILDGTLLTLDVGKSIDLSYFLDNTDGQQLSLVSSTLSLENGGTVDLSPFLNEDTDIQRLTLDGYCLVLRKRGSSELIEHQYGRAAVIFSGKYAEP